MSIEQFTVDLTGYFRDLLFIRTGVTRDTLLGYAAADFEPTAVGRWTPQQLEKAVELLLAFYRGIRFSLNPRFELELALSRLARLDDLVSPAELRDAIAELRAGAGPGARPAAAPISRPQFVHSEKPPAVPAAAPLFPTVAATVKATAPTVANSVPAVKAAASAPPEATATPAAPVSTATEAVAVDPRDLVAKLMEVFRREKPAVVAALEKAAATLEGRGAGALVLAAEPVPRRAGAQGKGRAERAPGRDGGRAGARLVRRSPARDPRRGRSGSSCCARCSAVKW